MRSTRAPAVSLAALLLATSLSAQRPTAGDSVTADSLRRARRSAIDLPRVVVSATLDRTPRAPTGVATSVIPTTNPAVVGRQLADALRLTPGAYIDLAAGPGGPALVRLRGGEEVFTQVLADGVKINDNGGFFDMQGVTVGTVDRVEVARGPQSALFGSSAMSGVVQLLSTPGTPGRLRLHGTLEGGGAAERGGNYRGTIGASGGSDRLRYAAGGELAYDRGIYAIAHDLQSRGALLRLDASPAPRLHLTGIGRFMGMESNLPVRDPGATRIPLDPDANETRDRWISSLEATLDRGATTHRLRVSRFDRTFVYDDRKNGIAPDGAFPFFVFDATFHLRSVLGRSTVDYVGTSRLGAMGPLRDVGLSYGGAWERETLRDRTSGDFGDGDQRFARASGALYAEAYARASPRLALLAGVRAEKYPRLGTQLVPRASAVFDVVPDRFSLRVATGRAYKAPDLQVVYAANPFIVSNPDLAAETSTSFEIGADASTRGRMLTGSLTLFRQRYDNLIRSVPFEGTDKSINRNLGRSVAEGVEASVVTRPAGGWEGGLQGSWTSTDIKENSGLAATEYPLGGELPFRPRYVAGAFVRAPFGDRVSVTLRGDAMGKQTVLTERFSGRRVILPGHTIGGAIAESRITTGTYAYVRLSNAFDRRFPTAYDRPATRRAIVVGLSWRDEHSARLGR